MKYLWIYLRTYLIIKRKQIFQKYFSSKNQNNTYFIILTTPRSGSTLLHTYLNSHPDIYSYGEILRKLNERDPKMLNKSMSQLIFHPHHVKSVGLKMFYAYSQMDLLKEKVSECLGNKKIKIIHLTRQNTLDEFISLTLARKTDKWSTTKEPKKVIHQKIHIKPQALISYLKEKEVSKRIIDQFSHHQVLEIDYEDLVSNPTKQLEMVQEFIGVRKRPLFTLLRKQNTNLENLIANYSELNEIYQKIKP